MNDEDPTEQEVGNYPVRCPICSEVVEIPVTCKVLNGDLAHQGEARLYCEPQMADMWAHMWAHGGAE